MNNERQFEHIEDKIRAAAENNMIVFDESSWKKMEVLLNKKESKRKFLWFWFLFPFALIGTYFSYSFISNKKVNEIKYAKNIKLTSAEELNYKVKLKNDNAVINNFKPFIKEKLTLKNKKITFSNKNEKNKIIYKKIKNEKKRINTYNQSKKEMNAENLKIDSLKINTKTKIEISNEEVNVAREKIIIDTINKEIVFQKNTIIDSTKTLEKKNNIKKTNNKKENKQLASFYIIGSFGADAGATNLLAVNRKEMVSKYGLGIGFSINSRVSIQTGFYKSNKKYIAGPNDYETKAGTYLSLVKINKVEATCLIYEIPLDVRYTILNKKQFTLFSKVGISSFVMKNENYKVFYSRNNYQNARSYSYTGNDHLFSNASIAIGFEKKITKKIALQLEPSISIPLNGVGEGKVKLFSTAMLLNLKYSPFKR